MIYQEKNIGRIQYQRKRPWCVVSKPHMHVGENIYYLQAQKNPIAIHKTFVMLFGMLKFHQKSEQIEDSLFCISRKRHYMYTFISRVVVECDYCVVFEHARLHNLIFHQGT